MKKHSKISKETKAGLYLTIIIHLIVLILFLSLSIKAAVKQETSFVLDFTRQEELEKIQKEIELKESVSKELDEMISQARRTSPRNIRNVAVDASESHLKDDRSKNPSQVYDDARALQKKLDAARREAEAEQGTDEVAVKKEGKDEKNEEKAYKGPSVLSYRLEGRKALHLPIPAYKCVGDGDVTVAIVVNRKGVVTYAKIIETSSSSDICLQEYAKKAALRSRFTGSQTAPERQGGEIRYRFIAQ